MTNNQRKDIVRISKDFVSGFKDSIELNGSGWMIVDPLSAFLSSIGYKNTVSQMEANDNHPQVLIIEFPDGSQLIPAGRDLKVLHKQFKNCIWI